jgi:hypothetical protein
MKNRHRYETQKHQREARGQFHPRSLARAVAHSRMKFADFEHVNKVHPGTTESTFSKKWREVVATMTR